MRIPLCLAAFATAAFSVSAQESAVSAPEMQVTSTLLAGVQQVGQDTSLATGLQSLPGLIVLPQGLAGGQSDFSIRGSTFSAAGLSLGGLALRNAQTEHFHAELPFPGTWFGTPDVLTGVRQAALSEGHLTGTVSLVPLPIRPGIQTTVGMDNKDGTWGNVSAQTLFSEGANAQNGAGAFVEHLSVPGVDLPDNDVESTRVGVRAQHIQNDGQTDVMLGHQDKTFGTRGYYGVSPLFDSEENTRDTLAFLGWRNNDPAAPFDTSIAFREFEDDYKLFLPSGLFHNEHRTRSLAGQFGGATLVSETLALRYRLAADREEIESESLGDFERSRLAATALPVWAITPDLRLMAGVRGEILEGDEDRLLPLARIELNATEQILLHAEYSQSVRRPSFTELNYESPGSLGNSGLGLQDQEAYEAGLTWTPSTDTRLSTTVFHHQTFDTVDWTRPDALAPRWLANNIGRVDTTGLEVALTRQISKTLQASASGLWLDKDADNAPYSSRYALDYAELFLRGQLDWTPTPALRIEASQIWRDQAPNALRDEGGDEQFLTQLALHVRILENVQLSLMAQNALDDDYRVYPGQDTVTGRRISAALTVDW